MELAPGIHNVITEGQPAAGVTNTYLVIGTEGAIWVDTGWDREGEAQARIDYWRRVGSPVTRGFAVTHRHPPHWGNAPAIQAVTGGLIFATEAEREVLEERMGGARVGHVVADGETLSLGDLTIEFVHAPGHTYGSLAIHIPERRALFTGDNVMGIGTSVVNPGEGEIALFLRTMEKFLALNLSVIYPGQGPVLTDPNTKLRELIEHRRQRELAIVEQLRLGPKTLDELYGAIYPPMDERLTRLGHNQIRSHLIKLENEHRVIAENEAYRLLQ